MAFDRKPPQSDRAEIEFHQVATTSELARAIDHEIYEEGSTVEDLTRQWLASLRDAEGENLPEKINDTGMAADFIPDSQIDAGASLPPGGGGIDDLAAPSGGVDEGAAPRGGRDEVAAPFDTTTDDLVAAWDGNLNDEVAAGVRRRRGDGDEEAPVGTAPAPKVKPKRPGGAG